MTKLTIYILMMVCWAGGAAAIDSYKYTMPLGSSEIQARTPADESLGNYITVTFTLPKDVTGKTVRSAFLEFYADVSAKPINGFVNTSPVAEVFALTNAFSGSLDPDDFDRATKTARPVVAGPNRRISLNITRIVKKLAQSPSATHTLVVGSLQRSREGVFTMKTGILPDDALAQIRFYFE